MRRLIRGLLIACVSSVMLGCGGGSDSSPPPAAPSTLSVEPGDTVNTVQWPAVSGATSYNLYWSETTPVAEATAQVIEGVVSPYQHTGRTNGTLIYYAVTAVDADGESALSPEVGAMPVAPVPAAPTTVNATPGDTMVTLSWSPVSRADSYNLYWSNSAGPMPGGQGVTRIANIQTTSYAHVGLTNGNRYYYRVTAVNTGGESAVSTEFSVTPLPPAPGAPANLTGTTGDTHVHLSWSAVTGATSYNVYSAQTPGIAIGGAGVTQTTGITTTAYEPSGLTNGETYYFRVSAIGDGGESALSDEISVRPLPPAPPAPLGLTAIAPKDVVQVTVQWFDVTDYPSSTAPIQLGYNIYRGLQPGLATYYKDASRATKIANVTAPFVDATVSKNTTYYYVVTSFVPSLPDVESIASGEVSATTSRAGGETGGEGDTGFGTNLSFPLIFADAYGIAGAKITGTWPGVGPFSPVPTFDYNTGLRPLSTQTLSAFPFLSSTTSVSLGGVTYYPQATESTWQAEWRSNTGGNQLDTIVDWGDALLSKTYTASSMVRIETTLKQDATIAGITDTMAAYRMALLSGSQTTELQGTDGSTYASATRNVFAINARLKIEKIATGGGEDTVVFDKSVYESLGSTDEGGGGGSAATSSKYGAELNMAGTLVYGYNFRLNSVTGIPIKTGQYRITFSLDPQATVGSETVANHVRMVGKSDTGATLAGDGLSSSVIITVN